MERKEILEKVLMIVLKEFVWNDEVFWMFFIILCEIFLLWVFFKMCDFMCGCYVLWNKNLDIFLVVYIVWNIFLCNGSYVYYFMSFVWIVDLFNYDFELLLLSYFKNICVLLIFDE